jgi:endonuclease YncB( thermonuclease family)
MKTINIVKLIVIAIIIPSAALADIISGEVIKISDGDTLTMLTDANIQLKVRLTEIDAPEKKQAFGNVSKQALSSLCFRKKAIVNTTVKDRYGRILGRVTCAGIDANAEQIKTGMAWVYDKYVTDKSLYNLQDQAKNNNIGLWADPHPTPPWLFRHQ